MKRNVPAWVVALLALALVVVSATLLLVTRPEPAPSFEDQAFCDMLYGFGTDGYDDCLSNK